MKEGIAQFHGSSCSILFGLLAVVPVLAQADPLDDTIVELMKKRSIPGLSLAVIDNGKIIKARGYGVVEFGNPTPVTESTLFQAGSVSKPVAAFGAMRLVEAGKIPLDADVNSLLKTWKVPEVEFTTLEKVTLRRLLSHTAGLTVHGFPGYAVDAPRPTLVQILNGEQPANTAPIVVDILPGSANRYSGGGYTVMQQLVIDVTSKSYPAYMQEAVLGPLGMTSSTYEQPLPLALAAKTATGHLRGKAVPGKWHIYPEMAAAGLWSTASDIARFAIGVQQALAGTSALMKRETAERMLTEEKNSYALGFGLSKPGEHQRFSHGGRDEGFDMYLVAYKNLGKGAAIMINKNEDSSFTNRVVSAIATTYSWPSFDLYKPLQPIEDKEPAVTTQVKQIFVDAQAGTFKQEIYTRQLAEFLTTQFPDGPAVQQIKSYGSLRSIALIERRTEGKGRLYRYFIEWEQAELTATVVYDETGAIAGLNVGQ